MYAACRIHRPDARALAPCIDPKRKKASETPAGEMPAGALVLLVSGRGTHPRGRPDGTRAVAWLAPCRRSLG